MLPRPRPRPDPDLVRERLRALAAGGAAPSEPGDQPPRLTLPPAARPVLLAVGATALAAWLLLRTVTGGAPTPVALVPGTPMPVASGSLSAIATPSSPPDLVVHVLGQVKHPGLVRLPPGSRVADAIAAAGGLRKGGSSGALNLARLLVDGEQVDVVPDAAPDPPATTGGGLAAGPLNLNTATLEQLDTLPGVGPVMAQRILDWRAQNGRFASVDQLREVSGVGDRTFERLSPLVTV
ncbi:MAG: helix-hairpin-helix domain-containing protein [Candidatus Nanopelagicales bacterium]